MQFSIGDRLNISGDSYDVIGRITYRNRKDRCVWDEYRLISSSGQEKWLSVDDAYKEYSLSWPAGHSPDNEYHVVDEGTQVVVKALGDVDVDNSETAIFIEFEDSTEERIMSIEKWCDGVEVSQGYYLEPEHIQFVESLGMNNPRIRKATVLGRSASNVMDKVKMVFYIVVFVLFGIVGAFSDDSDNYDEYQITTTAIRDYLGTAASFSYVTDIIDGNVKDNVTVSDVMNNATEAKTEVSTATQTDTNSAKVFTTDMSADTAAKLIIDGIEGTTEEVQQNTDDGDTSIAILTRYEYCLVYVSMDNVTTVQVCPREYAYSDNYKPYRSRVGTNRYYRRFYHSWAHSSDSTTYSSIPSAYTDYADTDLSSNLSDTYRSYSDTVRQDSINARRSSGGGTSYGK